MMQALGLGPGQQESTGVCHLLSSVSAARLIYGVIIHSFILSFEGHKGRGRLLLRAHLASQVAATNQLRDKIRIQSVGGCTAWLYAGLPCRAP